MVRFDFPNNNHFNISATYHGGSQETRFIIGDGTIEPAALRNVRQHSIYISNARLTENRAVSNQDLVIDNPPNNNINPTRWDFVVQRVRARYVVGAISIDMVSKTNPADVGRLAVYYEKELAVENNLNRPYDNIIGAGLYINDGLVISTLIGHAGTFYAQNAEFLNLSPFQSITGLDVITVGYNFDTLPTIQGQTVTVHLRQPQNVALVNRESIQFTKLNEDGTESNERIVRDLPKIYANNQQLDLGMDLAGNYHIQRTTHYKNGMIQKSAKLHLNADTDQITEIETRESDISQPEFDSNSPLLVFNEVDASLPQLSDGRCN